MAKRWQAPFTPEQVKALERYQQRQDVHHYTCADDTCMLPLVPEVEGLRCAECGRLQRWSHVHDTAEELGVEQAFQLIPRLEAVIAEVRKQAVLTGPKPTDDQVQEALKEAVAGIYFYGVKKFSRHTCEAYLWKVVKALNPRLFELLLQDKQAAYDMAHYGHPTEPEAGASDG